MWENLIKIIRYCLPVNVKRFLHYIEKKAKWFPHQPPPLLEKLKILVITSVFIRKLSKNNKVLSGLVILFKGKKVCIYDVVEASKWLKDSRYSSV